tara:strand:- start:180 stop:503 length:324 start_codon:yes stop_codon:yes gene_type:complete
MAAKIKKGDSVIILSGKDKGKTGKILKILKNKDKQDKAIVEGANIVKKHTKQSATQKGGIESIEMPMFLSKLSLLDPKTSKPSRVGFKFLKDGKKVRFSKKSGETLN